MFNLILPTKPYVHHYLVTNFGDPSDLSSDFRLHNQFKRCLKKPSKRWNNKYKPLSLARYSVNSSILITEDEFYRHGWEMTKTDVILFGRELENRVKFLMRNMVSMYETFKSQKDAIITFQENFGYTEEIWNFDSIKKDYFRNGPECKVDFLEVITNNSERILLGNLSDLGTISHKLIKDHARNKQNA